MAELNFAEDLAIDLDDLHEEWRKHAGTRYKYACELTDLEKIVRKAEEKIKVVRSNLRKEVWKDPEKTCDKPKVTDKDVEAYYRTHEDHKEAKDNLIDAKHNLSMAWNAVHAFDDRKVALENEVKLHGRAYFATPREEREVKSGKLIIDTNREKVQTTQRGALNKKRKRRK